MFRKTNKSKRYELLNESCAYDDAVISWVSPETVRHERGLIWKINIGLILALIIFGGFIYNAWTFSLVTAVFAGVYYLVHLEHPKDVEVKISRVGVKVGSRRYPFNRIKFFWVLYEPPYVKTLNLRLESEFISDLTIQLNGQDPADVRDFLKKHSKELEGQNEKLSDIFLRLFKI